MAQAASAPGERFAFGKNWLRFLERLDEPRVRAAEASLLERLELPTLAGLRFLDIGCGSGLFSLAARRLGARVHAFDYDADSVACARTLRARFFPDDAGWTVEQGSVLDPAYVRALGRFDVVYSWGVLHHTGALFTALDHAAWPLQTGGRLFIAIYNDQGRASRRWLAVKRAYHRLPAGLRPLVVGPAFLRLWGPTALRDTLRGDPLASWRAYGDRGMTPWIDVIDWVGGLPFEVARPEQIFAFYRARGFELTGLTTCGGGNGCNEYVFLRRAC